MNLDRALAILGVIIGALGAAAGVYVSQKDYNLGLLLASGWIAAALIGLTICSLAFRAVTAMERTHSDALSKINETQNTAVLQLDALRKSAERKAELLDQELNAVKAEVTEFRNISRALSAVVNGEDKPIPPRAKRRPKASITQVDGPNQE